jgi:hypothetical protein
MAEQLDLFLDSRAVQRANDVVAALQARDAARAGEAYSALVSEDRAHPGLAEFAALIQSLDSAEGKPRDNAAIAARLVELDRVIAPAARRMLGERAKAFVDAFVRDLALTADTLAFDPRYPSAHAASLWLRCAEYGRAETAAATVEGTPTDPNVLHWLSISRNRLRGIAAARPPFFALCLSQPMRVDALRMELADALLDRDWAAFSKETASWADADDELPRWFPAWYLLRHAAAASDFEGVELSNQAAAEAVRLLLRILPLERARDLRPLAALRQRLRNTHDAFFALYMFDRTVRHA